ncbi:MAG: hypothetical protein P3X22_003645 [Thermoprotei archaeon]|nr:hypothetical protein [Thermoprotei archaeon]
MSSIRLFYSQVALHWGYIIRVPGATAAQPALTLAPPTTVAGAFAASLLRVLGFREGIILRAGRAGVEGAFSKVFECILKSTVAASMGLHPIRDEGVGLSVIMEPSRLIAAPYKTGGDRRAFEESPWSIGFYKEGITKALPVQAVGATYGPSALVDLVWAVDVESLVKCLPYEGASVENIDRVGHYAVYGVTRLGSKEGICSAVAACYVEEPVVINVGETFTAHTYVPAKCVAPLHSQLVSRVQMWDLSYLYEDYYAPSKTTLTLAYPPAYDPSVLPSYRLVDGCKAYHIKVDKLPGKCEKLKEMKSIEWAVAVGRG